MDYLGKQISGRDIATVELLEQIYGYFDESGAALNALALGGVSAEDYAKKEYVDDSIADLVGTAPESLDTIQELASALKENADVVATLDEAITNKANQSDLDDAVARIDALEENPSLTAESIKTALGYTPANDSDLDNFYTKQEINSALDGYLPTTGGTVEYIDTNKVTSVEIEVESLAADSIRINGDLAILENHSLYLSQENYINGDQGGLYIISEAGNITLDSREYIDFKIKGNDVCTVSETGLGVEGDLIVTGNITIEGVITGGLSLWDNEKLYLGQTNYLYGNQGGIHVGKGDLIIDYGNRIECSVFQSQDFSFGYNNTVFLSFGEDEMTINNHVTIKGDLSVTGNIRSSGTMASGGKAQEGDTALADLEARVAALESLIS